MTLKKINPEDLQPGKKYLVELEFKNDKHNSNWPLVFVDVMGSRNLLPAEQPIYTHEPSIEPLKLTAEPTADKELQMLVSVASRLWATGRYNFHLNRCTKEAIDLINACKMAIKEGKI